MTEDNLSGLDKQVESVFNNIPSGLCVYRIEGDRIIHVFHNESFIKIMGFSDINMERETSEMQFSGVHPKDLPPLKKKVLYLAKKGGIIHQNFRMFHDQKQKYIWIHFEAKMEQNDRGELLLYGLFSDISVQKRLEKELVRTKEKMEDIVNAIPGGVAMYKVTDVIETVYFSDGIPKLTGYTSEEYANLGYKNALELSYSEDTAMVAGKVQEAIDKKEAIELEFRMLHKNGNIVWVRASVKLIGEKNGYPLLHCVYHNITDLKETQIELEHLINSIPGGIAIYHLEGERLHADFLSDGTLELIGCTREEYDRMISNDVMDVIYEKDRRRVYLAMKTMLFSGKSGGVSCRIRRKNGKLVWIHINGIRMDQLTEKIKLYVVFTGLSSESRLYRDIANETADGIYVIDRENYDILYANEPQRILFAETDCIGKKCYSTLYKQEQPCEFCTLKCKELDCKVHEMSVKVDGIERYYSTRFREMNWNGIPAYVKYVRDITEEVKNREENERINLYFQTLVKNLPNGVAVVKFENDGSMKPEYLSDKFSEMTGMTSEEAWELYSDNALHGVHPDDMDMVNKVMEKYLGGAVYHCELVYRLRKGKDGYVWVRNTLSLIQNEQGTRRIYAVYQDITKEKEEQDELKHQYNALIIQHYKAPAPNALIIGHCNITRNHIIEIMDYTDSNLVQTFGTVREDFFYGLSSLIPNEQEKQAFLCIYLRKPALEAYSSGKEIRNMRCFMQPSKESRGSYVEIKMNMVASPGGNDVMGVLTIVDITDKTIADLALRQLSTANYDFVTVLDLFHNRYSVLLKGKADYFPEGMCDHAKCVEYMVSNIIIPRDREKYKQEMEPDRMMERLLKEGSYSFAVCIQDDRGDIHTKNVMVSAIDLRLGKVCLAEMDITDSVREQRGLLNMLAYTFELAGIIDIRSGFLTLYTRQIVLENLSPRTVENYEDSLDKLAMFYDMSEENASVNQNFALAEILKNLKEKPEGYDFVIPFIEQGEEWYKQINVLWGDVDHHTVCVVRADVTDTFLAERKSKADLEKALLLAEQASRAKSDFLSAMSHDIRTPMNAIMGMTTLASANLEDKERVADCLQKIAISSTHLLSLINDVLDMSKIEHSKLILNREKISVRGLIGQLTAIMEPQARERMIDLKVITEEIRHEYFYGDSLRINQILINILGNAVKFTPECGTVILKAEETEPIKHPGFARFRFTVSDTGIGIKEDFVPYLFDSFSRSNNSRYVGGTGLGLSITKGLVDLMEGDITVESRVNEGTEFCVELEYECVDEEREAQVREYRHGFDMEHFKLNNADMFAGCRFLIAEDNEINAEIICELLENFGGECVLKKDGQQTFQEYCDAPAGTYQAILMDIQMPVMNGYETTRAIRQYERSDAGSIPIVAMTANAFAEDVKSALDAGMNAHVAKPIDIKNMCKVLCDVISNDRRLLLDN